jgi:hypothetical protein
MGKPTGPHDEEFRGNIDKLVVVRQNKLHGTIYSGYPDMSRVEASPAQLAAREKFRKAQHHAKLLLSDADTKAFYQAQCGPGKRPHNFLISAIMKGIIPLPPDEGPAL